MFDLPTASIDFDCGTTATNVGHMGMAIKAHAKTCADAACLADLAASGYLS